MLIYLGQGLYVPSIDKPGEATNNPCLRQAYLRAGFSQALSKAVWGVFVDFSNECRQLNFNSDARAKLQYAQLVLKAHKTPHYRSLDQLDKFFADCLSAGQLKTHEYLALTGWANPADSPLAQLVIDLAVRLTSGFPMDERFKERLDLYLQNVKLYREEESVGRENPECPRI